LAVVPAPPALALAPAALAPAGEEELRVLIRFATRLFGEAKATAPPAEEVPSPPFFSPTRA
jgi:hypothetical protein